MRRLGLSSLALKRDREQDAEARRRGERAEKRQWLRLRPGRGNIVPILTLYMAPVAVFAQQGLTCSRGQCVQVFSGAAAIGPQLRVDAHGPVTLEGAAARELMYTARVSVRARNAAEARRILERYRVEVTERGGWHILSSPAGPWVAALTLKSPRLSAAVVSTTDGPVSAANVNGFLEASSGAGPLGVDRIAGDCRLLTRGGDVNVGFVRGALQATTGAGPVTVRSVGGEAVLQTVGGDILVQEVGGSLRASTGAGTVRVEKAGAAVSATTGGGQIWVGSAKGIVNARNIAGLVHVGSAAGVTCNSGAGGVSLGPISGAVQVSTAMGSINATLAGARAADSYLATGNGDVTVSIPSNVGVTIQAVNDRADTLRRIVSEFPQIAPRLRGTQVVAEGTVNGGGPLVRIVASAGTIFIKSGP